jgi:O-acetyl-ADP-ribose deacetylase (regulator of RNase III)
MDEVQFRFIDINKEITDAWEKVFEGVANVEVIHGSIFDHPSDALVSPANSFGFMNGGIDFVISKNLGWHIEKKVQQLICDKYYGELLVGQADYVTTEHQDFPYLIAAPTMRTPMATSRGPNVYLCMKAILQVVRYGRLPSGQLLSNQVRSVAIPGLGTGIGQVNPMVCARQMRIAWEDVVGEKWTTKPGWQELRSNYAYFYTHEKDDIKYDIP